MNKILLITPAFITGAISLFVAYCVGDWNFHIYTPLMYGKYDDIWQYTMTKFLTDSGWIFEYSLLGAPVGVDWHYHSAPQTSMLHSILLKLILIFIPEPIAAQQFYYILNFPIISIITFIVAKEFRINTVVAVLIGCAFGLASTRFNIFYYSYLGNYFTVSLGILVSYWIYNGKFEINTLESGLKKYRKLFISSLLVVIIGTADGYYAFFTIILIAFSSINRLLFSNNRSNTSKSLVIVYGCFLLTILFVNYPLYSYKKTHVNEFNINGAKDPVLIKRPFEAEVYSQTLKLIFSPNPDHHLEKFRTVAAELNESANLNRKNPTGQFLSFGIFGVVGLLAILFFIMYAKNSKLSSIGEREKEGLSYLSSSAILIILFSTTGGLGSLVAYLIPSIRAYERFELFLFVDVLLFSGILITKIIEKYKVGFFRVIGIAVLCGSAIIFDQIPRHAHQTNNDELNNFYKDSGFVKNLESSGVNLVYNYPYSQYLTNNNYYGWGSFAHIRLNLHSNSIQWSNGPQKNSPLDILYNELSKYDIEDQLIAASSLGFERVVIDKTVVKSDELKGILSRFDNKKIKYINNEAYNFVEVMLPVSSIKFNYAGQEDGRIIFRVETQSELNDVTENPLIKLLALPKKKDMNGIELIWPRPVIDPGKLDPSAKNFSIKCANDKLYIKNISLHNLQLGAGEIPIIIGIHATDANNTIKKFDTGFRFSEQIEVPVNDEVSVKIPYTVKYNFKKMYPNSNIGFQLLQEGNAWIGNFCSQIVKP